MAHITGCNLLSFFLLLLFICTILSKTYSAFRRIFAVSSSMRKAMPCVTLPFASRLLQTRKKLACTPFIPLPFLLQSDNPIMEISGHCINPTISSSLSFKPQTFYMPIFCFFCLGHFPFASPISICVHLFLQFSSFLRTLKSTTSLLDPS